jgi:hypothetical protein
MHPGDFVNHGPWGGAQDTAASESNVGIVGGTVEDVNGACPKAELRLKSSFLARLKRRGKRYRRVRVPQSYIVCPIPSLRRLRPRRALRGRDVTQTHYARIVYSWEGTVAVMNIRAPQRGSSKTVIGIMSLRCARARSTHE